MYVFKIRLKKCVVIAPAGCCSVVCGSILESRRRDVAVSLRELLDKTARGAVYPMAVKARAPYIRRSRIDPTKTTFI